MQAQPVQQKLNKNLLPFEAGHNILRARGSPALLPVFQGRRGNLSGAIIAA
jgi:hypothetical protein